MTRTRQAKHCSTQDGAVRRYLKCSMHRPEVQLDLGSIDGTIAVAHHCVRLRKVVRYFELRSILSNEVTATHHVAPRAGQGWMLPRLYRSELGRRCSGPGASLIRNCRSGCERRFLGRRSRRADFGGPGCLVISDVAELIERS